MGESDGGDPGRGPPPNPSSNMQGGGGFHYRAYRASEYTPSNESYQFAAPKLRGWNDPPIETEAALHNDSNPGTLEGSEGNGGSGNTVEHVMDSINAVFEEIKKLNTGEPSGIHAGLIKTIAAKLDKLKERISSKEMSSDIVDKLLKIAQLLDSKKHKEAEEIAIGLAKNQIVHGETWVSGLKWLLGLAARADASTS